MATVVKYNAKKRTYTGTNENDVLDATTLDYVVPQTGKNKDKGLTIKGVKGNDIITGTAGNDIITGGAGENTIVVKMEKFGNDVVNLTKGEDLVIDLTANTDLIELDDIRLTLVGKNLVITVPEDEEYDFGKITLKNYTKNTLNSLTFKFFEQEPITFNSFSELTESTVFLYRNENLNKKGVLTASNYDDDIVIQNTTNKKYTINAGNGKNEIGVMSGKYVINSGKDNDYISITDYNKKGSYTINAGGGENTIYIDNYGEYGEVIISEQKLNAINTIELSEDLKNPEYKRVKNDMYIVDDNGTIILKNYYANVKNKSTINISICDEEAQSLSDYLSEQTAEITGSGKINGTDSQDIITITGKGNATINAGKGDDTIGYAKGNRTIYLSEGDGNDIVEAGGGTDTLKFASGTNITAEVLYDIDGKTKLVVHYGTKGDSITFKEYNTKSKIYYYVGNKKYSLSSQLPIGNNIEITSYKTHYDGTDKNDTIVDSLVHTLENTITINALDGDDYIDAHHDIVHAGAGNDYVHSIDSSVFGEAGNDTIVNYGSSSNNNSSVEIYGGDGDDSILNEKYSYAKKIYGNDGDDVIINSGYVTNIIDGGEGNDKITLRNDSTISGELYGGGGNDNIVVESNVSVNTIYADSSNTQSTNDGDDKVTVEGTVGTLYTTGGNDEINILKDGTISTIYSGNGNDVINISGYTNTIYSGDGDNTISVDKNASASAICGGNNQDEIINKGTSSRIISYLGNDIITNYGRITNSINAGEGDDIITTGENSSTRSIEFHNGDGHDTLYLNSKEDVLYFNNIADLTYTWSDDEKDLIISYNNNSDSVTIKDFDLNSTVYITTDGKNIYLISDLLKYKNGISGFENCNFSDLTFTYNIIKNDWSYNTNNLTISDGNIQKSISFNADSEMPLETIDSILALDENNILKRYSILDDAVIYQPGLLTGTNRNDKIIIDKNASVNGLKGNDTIINNYNSLKNVINGNEGDDTIINNGIITSNICGNEDNDSITNNGTVNYIYGGDGNDVITNNGTVSNDIKGEAGEDTITNNKTVTNNINGGDDNDNITNEINGTVKNIYGDAGNDTITNNGTVTNDIKGDTGDDKITLRNNSTISGKLYGGGGNDNIVVESNVTVNTIYADSSNTQSANDGDDKVTVEGTVGTLYTTGGNDEINILKGGTITTIYSGNGNDVIINNETVKNIYGDAGEDIITNNGTIINSIIGGSGNDIITTTSSSSVKYIEFNKGDGDDTLYLGAKKDILKFNEVTDLNYAWSDDEKDLIISYNNNSDSVTIKDFNLNNNSIYVETKNISILLSDFAISKIIFYSSYSNIMGSADKDVIINYGKVSIKYNNDQDSGRIFGYEGDDIIINSGTVEYGIFTGNGNDTIVNNGRIGATGVAGGIDCGSGDDIIINNGEVDYIAFYQGSGNDTLYLDPNAWRHNISFSGDISYKIFSWQDNDLIIKYKIDDNFAMNSIRIKNCPTEYSSNIYVGTNNRNYVHLSSLIPEKPTTQTMSLGTSNTRICELSAEVLAFTSTNNSDMQLNYTTPDTNDISVVMSEYTNTDLQGGL